MIKRNRINEWSYGKSGDPIVNAERSYQDDIYDDESKVDSAIRKIDGNMSNFPRNSHIGVSKNWGNRVKVKSVSKPTDSLNHNNSYLEDEYHWKYAQDLFVDGKKIGTFNYKLDVEPTSSEDWRDWCEWHCSFNSETIGNFKDVAFFWFSEYKNNERAVAWNRLPIIINLSLIANDGAEANLLKPTMMSTADFKTYVLDKLVAYAKKFGVEEIIPEIEEAISKITLEDDGEEVSEAPEGHRRSDSAEEDEQSSTWNESFLDMKALNNYIL